MTPSEISVVIPVYNGALHLAETVETVLAQTAVPAAIVVVDDGSEDETPRVAARFASAIRYVRQPNAGLARARNAGVENVDSEYLAFLDGDDLWSPDKLEKQLAELCSCERPAMIFSHAVQFVSPELAPREVAALKFDSLPVPGIIGSALFMRTRDFRAVGPFDGRLRVGEFIDWYARAIDAGVEARVLSDTLLRRRIHRGNLGRRRAEFGGDYARALKATLDRRRHLTAEVGGEN
jgi:glycosyltransferase involved in cell wall biosynthesis